MFCLFRSRCNNINLNRSIKWAPRKSYTKNERESIVAEPLINLPELVSNLILPMLHIKLGVFSSFIRSLNKRKVIVDNGKELELEENTNAFNYLKELFPNKTISKVKNGTFNGPEINKILKNKSKLSENLNEEQKRCLEAFSNLKNNFFTENRSSDYKNIVKQLIDSYEQNNVLLAPKIHYLMNHLDKIEMYNYSYHGEEQGEQLHQQIKIFSTKYLNKRNMLRDFCWMKIGSKDTENIKRKKTYFR